MIPTTGGIMRLRSALAVTGLAIAASLGSAGAASADPHDLASTTILVPTSFGEFHGSVTDSDGNVIDEFVDPPMTRAVLAIRRGPRPRRAR
jgi:hypothetical protein